MLRSLVGSEMCIRDRSKIDTQGLSGPATKGCKDNIFPKDADGNPIYPPFNPTPLPIFNTKERAELKEIMLEALREYYDR